MERNEAGSNRFRGPQNYVTLTQQHRSYVSQTQNSIMNNETIEGHDSILSLTHVDSSQVLNSIPLYYSKMHVSNDTNSPNTSSKDVLEERKHKRMFSNRESAHRSRIRKKQQIESLQSHLDHLQTLNRQLSEKIIYLLECNQKILEHNAQLKDKVSSLQVALTELLCPLGKFDQHHHLNSSNPTAMSYASTFEILE